MILRYLSNMSGLQRVLTALALGIIVGLFFGEVAGKLKVIGTIYVRLLQMTVLPYVLVSIISGLARLDGSIAREIGLRAGMVILFAWMVTMLTLCMMPFAFPEWQTAGFFSTSDVADKADFNFVNLFVPSNIFESLSDTVVPAVVLFCLLLGSAMISVPNKDTFLALSDNLCNGFMKVSSIVTKMAPIGVFAICASAAGTLSPEELGRLQVYLWIYLIAWALLAFIALPLLIQWATPFSFKEVMGVGGEAMITAMASGTVLVVLPMMVEGCKGILKNHNMDSTETSSAVDVLVPTSYSFPSVGSIMGIGFVLFSGWYVGSPLGFEDYFAYIILGVFSVFGGVTVAIPFLLDFFELPADQFQLYLLGTVVWGRTSVGLQALHGIIVSLLVAAALMKCLSWRKMFMAMGVHLAITAAIMLAAGIALTRLIPYEYTGDKTITSLQLVGKSAPLQKVQLLPPLSPADQDRQRLKVIVERGTIRVGYFDDAMPYVFTNNAGDLVGFDIDLINLMANDLGIIIEITKLANRKLAPQQLLSGQVDMVVGGIAVSPDRAYHTLFTDPYSYHTCGFVMPDARRDKFSSLEDILAIQGLRIGVRNVPFFRKMIAENFPNAEVINMVAPTDYFNAVRDSSHPQYGKVDVYVDSAEATSAWTLLNPEFSVVVPEGLDIKVPIGFALPVLDIGMAYYLNTWLKLKTNDGYVKQLYDYWILGKNPKDIKRRWSIANDVLGWKI